MRVTKEMAVASLRQKKAYELKYKQRERELIFAGICAVLSLYVLLITLG